MKSIKRKNKKIPKIFKIFDIKMAFYDFVKWTGAIPVLIFFRLKRLFYNKKEKGMFKGPLLIVSNHVAYSDPIVICNSFWCRRVCFVATDYFFQNKLLGLLFKGFGCIPVSKDNVAVMTFKKVSNTLNRGHCVALFPEGGVERNDQIDSFKAGAVMMALMSNVPIIPMYISKRTKWYKRQVVMIGNKLNVKDYIKSDIPSINEIQSVADKLQEIELNLENECNKRIRS